MIDNDGSGCLNCDGIFSAIQVKDVGTLISNVALEFEELEKEIDDVIRSHNSCIIDKKLLKLYRHISRCHGWYSSLLCCVSEIDGYELTITLKKSDRTLLKEALNEH